MIFLAFLGAPRMSKEVAHHVHESPPTMTVPLVVLAVLTVIAGWVLGVPSEQGTRFERLLAPVFMLHAAEHGGGTAIMLLVLSVIVVFAGMLLAWFNYGAGPVRAEEIGRPRTVVHRVLLNAWYVDWLYDRAIVRPLFALSDFFARLFDTRVVDGAVNGLGRAVVAWAQSLRQLQTGYVVNYALTMLAGAVAIVGFLLAR
jgi:NADH-quinone oxidoreductase subunit L